MNDATGLTAALTGIGGRHLLQGPPPPVTDQPVTALTDAGNAVVGAGTGLLSTLEVVPPPPARHLLQETPPPLTGDAALLNTVGAVLPACPLSGSQSAVTHPHLVASLPRTHLATACASGDLLPAQLCSHREAPLQVQQSLQGTVRGVVSDATGLTAALTGIGGRHLLQGPPPPVMDQLVTALTGTGNDVVVCRDWTAEHSGGGAAATSPLNSCTFR